MKKKSETFRLMITHYKILETVYELNKLHQFPSKNGVYNILKGSLDAETNMYQFISTYSSLISYQKKQFSFLILNLIRHGYLNNIYDDSTDKMYLRVTELGEQSLLKYKEKHPDEFKKKEAKHKPEIIEIK